MLDREFSYKGKKIRIEQKGNRATIGIDDREYPAVLHEEGSLPMWSCAESYFMSPDLKELTKHLADNLDILTADWRAPSHEDHGRGREDEGGAEAREASTRTRSRQSRAHRDEPQVE